MKSNIAFLYVLQLCGKGIIKIIKTMAEVICDYSSEAAKISFNLPDIAENILENIRENQKTTLQP